MRLTRYTDYALRTLIFVALSEPRQSSIAEIARAYDISESHLTKVVHQLGRLGLIKTMRGRGGGIRLALPPAEINIGSVVRDTEDDMALVECFGSGMCPITGPCRLKTMIGEALAAFLAVLDRYTLADIVDDGPGRSIMALLAISNEPLVRPVRKDRVGV